MLVETGAAEKIKREAFVRRTGGIDGDVYTLNVPAEERTLTC
jgi:hypothetical protein